MPTPPTITALKAEMSEDRRTAYLFVQFAAVGDEPPQAATTAIATPASASRASRGSTEANEVGIRILARDATGVEQLSRDDTVPLSATPSASCSRRSSSWRCLA